MKDMHLSYVQQFINEAEPILHSYGLKIDVETVCGASARTKIIIKNLDNISLYEISFATNHLDYNMGVCVYDINKNEQDSKLILPYNFDNLYTYNGDNRNNDITRLINDLVKILN